MRIKPGVERAVLRGLLYALTGFCFLCLLNQGPARFEGQMEILIHRLGIVGLQVMLAVGLAGLAVSARPGPDR